MVEGLASESKQRLDQVIQTQFESLHSVTSVHSPVSFTQHLESQREYAQPLEMPSIGKEAEVRVHKGKFETANVHSGFKSLQTSTFSGSSEYSVLKIQSPFK